MTFNTVANLGLPSGDKALYRLSHPSPVSEAVRAIPLARAISPKAAATKAGSPSSRAVSAALSMTEHEAPVERAVLPFANHPMYALPATNRNSFVD
jgi:hypothetical protein